MPHSPFIVDSNRASEPIEITDKFNGGLRYASTKHINMSEKKCPQCGMPTAKSNSYVGSEGEYIEVYKCSNPGCGNVWHHKPTE